MVTPSKLTWGVIIRGSKSLSNPLSELGINELIPTKTKVVTNDVANIVSKQLAIFVRVLSRFLLTQSSTSWQTSLLGETLVM